MRRHILGLHSQQQNVESNLDGLVLFISAGRFRIHDVDFLVEIGRHHRFNLKSVRIELMDCAAPCFGDGLSVLCILGHIRRIFQPDGERQLSSRDDGIFAVHALTLS